MGRAYDESFDGVDCEMFTLFSGASVFAGTLEAPPRRRAEDVPDTSLSIGDVFFNADLSMSTPAKTLRKTLFRVWRFFSSIGVGPGDMGVGVSSKEKSGPCRELAGNGLPARVDLGGYAGPRPALLWPPCGHGGSRAHENRF